MRTKFWKNELVGNGVERRWGEKKQVGSGRTVDWVSGKLCNGDMAVDSGGGCGGGGGDGGGLCKVLSL